ncbi:MAG: hypothetical protein HY675_10255 [Chloroflexi bacterium]|nr:hypothetical protein [Chloroflexota bacterium]
MIDRAFNDIKLRELRRFFGVVDNVVEGLLLKKYEETRNAEDYRDYAKVCGMVKANLRSLGAVVDKMEPLFETSQERPRWEIYLSGMRDLMRKMPNSYLFRFVLPTFGLEDLREKLSAYALRWTDQFHATHKVFWEGDLYLRNLARGTAIAQDFESGDTELPRLYASVKTWESRQEFDQFATALAEFLDLTVEVYVLGPVQLYLMIGRDTFLLICKALSVGKLSEIDEKAKDYVDLLQLHDFLHDSVEHSKTLAVTQDVLGGAAKEYVKRLREEHDRLRGQLPSKEMRYRFINRYETGVLFRNREE